MTLWQKDIKSQENRNVVCWQADKQASLITGFNKSLSKEEYLRKIASGDLMEVLNQKRLPKGMFSTRRQNTYDWKRDLIAEIQQNSDIAHQLMTLTEQMIM